MIIDGNSLINRAYYALPRLSNFDGVVSNGVFGFCNILVKAIQDIKPKYLCVAFDYGKKTFRNQMYDKYKGTRKPTPEDLKSQFPILKEVLQAMKVHYIEIEGVEADDIIGSLTKKFDVQNLVLTGDKDSFQLVNKNTSVLFTKRGISETVEYNPETLLQDYGITPSQVIDLKSLMGDASDNIPGVAGVGEKTAMNLLNEYKTLQGVYDHVDEVKGKLQEKLLQDKEMAFLSYKLATIKTDVPLSVELQELEYDFPFGKSVFELFEKYQFNSLLKRKDLFVDAAHAGASAKTTSIKRKELQTREQVADMVKHALQQKELTFVLDENVYFYFDKTEYVCNFNTDLLTQGLDMDETMKQLKPIFEHEAINKIAFDTKQSLHVLVGYGIGLKNVVFDVSLARYLINNLAKSNISLQDMIVEQGMHADLPSYSVFEMKNKFEPMLQDLGLQKLFYDIEMPLADVLFKMEQEGFKIDLSALKELDDKYSAQIEELTQTIYDLSGETFNINSPKQLGEVLFDKLGLVAWNNKKKSTGIDVLNDLKDKHPVVAYIMQYRKITKLYNTYVKAFGELVNKENDKIHTMFNQTNTATGRLSSNEPNLQNIPIRTEEGRGFRKIFVPTDDKGYIVTADYSQIELRLLASFSGDEKLIHSFINGEDIHAKTASEVFGIALKDITSAQRRDAKAINFGIIYGISDYGLSQNINTTRELAASYMKRYFERYPKVKEYMDANIAVAKETGFAKTMFGRIRYIPEINSKNYNLRNFGERAAMNMPLQGSASDIIKLAMVRVMQQMEQKQLKSKLILQIHDELLVDCAHDELEQVKEILKTGMETVVDLKVPLTVNVEYGKNWFEAK